MSQPLNPPAQAPAIVFTPEEWQQLPGHLEDPLFKLLHEHNLRELAPLKELAASPEALQTTLKEAMHRRIKGVLLRSCVAWHLTKKQVYLDIAGAALHAACTGTGWRVAPGKTRGIRAAGLPSGELQHMVAFTWDALFDQLSDQQHEMCLNALINKGLAAYHDGIALEDWWVRSDFNWNSAMHGNAGFAALAIREVDPELSRRTLEEARRGIQYMIDAYPPEGGWIEGLMYQCTATGHLVDFARALQRIEGDDLGVGENRNIHDSIDFLRAMHGGDGGQFNFSDAHHRGPGRAGIPHFYWLAERYNRPDWTQYLDEKFRTLPNNGLFYDVETFWNRRPHQPAQPGSMPRLQHFKGIDWLSWRGEKTWLGFRAGFNGGNHDNDDLGNIIFGVGTDRFLCDPGYGAPRASQHNCVTIRAKEQTDGATARTLRCDKLGETGFYLVCDIREAFPHILEHYDRHVMILDDQHLLLVDDIKGKGQLRNSMHGHLQTRLPVHIENGGFEIGGQENTLRVRFLSDVGWMTLEPWEFDQRPITTLGWRDVYDRIHTIQPILLTTGQPKVEHRISEKEVDLTIDGKRYRIPLRASWAGGEPTGLEIR